MTKPRRSDKSPAQRDWERARDRCKVESEDEMFRRDFRDKVRYTIPFDIIIYIDSTAKAEEHMGNLVPALSNQEYIYFGFDVEGTSNPKSSSSDPSFETLQLHTEIEK